MINPNIIPNGGRHGLKVYFILKRIGFQCFIFLKKRYSTIILFILKKSALWHRNMGRLEVQRLRVGQVGEIATAKGLFYQCGKRICAGRKR
jgi:hypothetical protein